MDFDSLDSKKVLKWEHIQAIGDLPDARRCHSLNAVGTSRLVLFAGDGHGGVRLKNDTYVFHINENRWEKLNIKGHQLPPQRWYHAATSLIPTWSDESPLYNSHILIFGGRSDFSYLNDLFLLDIENQTWTRVVPKGDTPAPRWCHTMTLLPGHRILLYGGSYEMGRSRQKYGFDDLHVLHLDKMEWKKHPIQVGFKNEKFNLHLQRESHTTCYSNNKIFISFGCSIQDEAIATVLIMDPETLHIMRFIDTSQLIPPLPTRQGSSATPLFQTNLTFTQTVNRIVFFGGEKDSKDREPLSDIIILETESERWFRCSEDFTVLPPYAESSVNNNNNETTAVRLARAYQAAEGIGSKVYVFGGQAESYENLLSDLLVLETEVCPPSLADQCIKFLASKESNFTMNDFLPLPIELTEKIIQQIRIMESDKNYLKLKNADQSSLDAASIASATETVDISESAQNEENEDESDAIFFNSFYDSMLSTLADKNLDDETRQFHIQQIIALLGLESTIQQMNVPPNKLKDTLIRMLLFAKMQLQLEPLDNHPEEEEEDDTSDNMSTVAVSSHAGERNPTTAIADDNVSVITDDMSLNSMNLQEEEDSDSQAS